MTLGEDLRGFNHGWSTGGPHGKVVPPMTNSQPDHKGLLTVGVPLIRPAIKALFPHGGTLHGGRLTAMI